MKKIYFLCTGNSCRSQMAEGFAKKLLKNTVQIRSAGIEQHGVNPDAIKVMAEVGIDISDHTSDLIEMDYFNACDLIITLCGDARDKCPVIPKTTQHEHWAIKDPAGHSLEEFRLVRDEIYKKVKTLDL
ncbi:arsenate reductase (thioredoxin) [Lactococcus hircilactis]|uniref:Arsenate reductase (Thioredoxin) n=1 Tax=Lactococcus hircilactis TaxID=1494462 RepID=A0A7X1Z8V4_9LACT|nr:arsenate reductase (thioredoxin) [Lactococcus hircilactis]MQW39837.1 arsenate reductase (thioredoxin) [Lactococcus hircilactis]